MVRWKDRMGSTGEFLSPVGPISVHMLPLQAMSFRISCLIYPALLGTLSSLWMISCSVVSTKRIVSIFVWAL